MTITCILCGDPGKPRPCCDHNPVFCDAHDAVHQKRVHADMPHRSIDEALEVAMQADEIDDNNDSDNNDSQEPEL